jgi:Cobalamin biosynthesis protein CbiK, Co2+ chelatase
LQNEFKAILLLTHAVDLDNAQEQYLNFEKAARVHFSAHTIYWVFTYGERKQILPGQEQFFSFSDAITQLYSQGCAQALVQPLYVVPGQEFKQLQQEVACFKKRNKGLKISLGAPLLSDAAAVKLFVQKLASEQEGTRPASQTILSRQATFSNGATIYVGHGSNDPDAEKIYNLLQQELQRWDKRFFSPLYFPSLA